MEAVRQVFKRPWFPRRWIIQKAALSPDGLMCCGEYFMPILLWFRAAVWIHHKQDHLLFDLEQEGSMLTLRSRAFTRGSADLRDFCRLCR
jgi:hypothetical protein